MKLYYIANLRLPTEKAHGIQIMKMSQAFVNQGLKLTLVVPKRFNQKIKQDPFEFYDLKKEFKITRLFCLDLMGLEKIFGKIAFLIQSFSFAFVVLIYCLLKSKKDEVLYIRHLFSVWLLSLFGFRVYYEIHALPKNMIFGPRFYKRLAGIIVITKNIKKTLIKKGIDNDKILVAPDGVDLSDFMLDLTKSECRRKLNLPQDKKIILYTGHLFKWKGASVLAEAAKKISLDCLVVFVGGTTEDIVKFKEKYSHLSNILIAGWHPYKEIPCWLKAADVLVLPNSGKTEISRYWTSPMKMFEYMTSQRPIVASDLPSMREVLNKKNAVLIKPDSSQRLAQSIDFVLKNPDFSHKLAEQAYIDIRLYTWDLRVKRIIEFISKRLNHSQ